MGSSIPGIIWQGQVIWFVSKPALNGKLHFVSSGPLLSPSADDWCCHLHLGVPARHTAALHMRLYHINVWFTQHQLNSPCMPDMRSECAVRQSALECISNAGS